MLIAAFVLQLLSIGLVPANPYGTLRAQALVAFQEKRYADALRLFNASIDDIKGQGLANTQVAVVLNDLGLTYQRMRRLSEAESKFQEARALYQSEPEARRELIVVVTNLGTLYADTGQYAHSGECFNQSLKIAKKVLSPDDVLFGTIFVGLAADRFRKGNYRSAQKYLEQALPIRQKGLGENHPDVAEVLNNLGVAQRKTKDYDKAVSNFLRARSIFERSSRSNPLDLANVLNNLGVAYHLMKKPAAEAEAVLRDAVEIYRKNLTVDQSGLPTALFDLAVVLLDDARPLEAEGLLKEAVARRAALKHRVEDADADAYEEYALALKRNGRVGDATVAEERAKSMRSQLRFMLRP